MDDGEEAGALTEIRKQEGHCHPHPGLRGLDLNAQVKMELFLSVLEGKVLLGEFASVGGSNKLVRDEGVAQGNVHVYEEV